ncbi:MAG: class I fructose-bisphosphate aldolase [Candidatus Poribacteria bacterium]
MIHHPGKTIRMGRLLDAESNRTLIVAIDHGLGGAASGIENLEQALEKIIAGNPEAIIMSAGVAKRFQYLLCGKGKPSIIVTVDHGSGSTLPSKGSRGEDYRLIVSVEDALKIGADAVKMVLVFGREDVKIHADNIQFVAQIASQCEQWRVPLLLEPVLWGKTVTAEDRENPQILKHICRIGFELGADILKVPYTGDVKTFREIVDICPLPIVILGGAKMATERDVLVTAAGVIEAGAIGIAFGRNIFQHPNPTGMIRALRKVIHEEANIDDALKMLRE